MRKILIFTLVLLSFGFSSSFADFSKSEKIVSSEANIQESEYREYYSLSRELTKLVNDYSYAVVFNKKDVSEIYAKLKIKFEKYKKLAQKIDGPYFKDITLQNILQRVDTTKILKELGYSKIYYDSYMDRRNSSFFEKKHSIDLSNLKLNDKVDGLYIGMNIIKTNTKDYYSKSSYLILREKRIKNIYLANEPKNIILKKIDPKKFDGKLNINVFKLVKDIKKDDVINVEINFYIKKGNSYISILSYPINDRFSFNENDIKYSFERKYRQENNPSYDFYLNDKLKEKMTENLNKKTKNTKSLY